MLTGFACGLIVVGVVTFGFSTWLSMNSSFTIEVTFGASATVTSLGFGVSFEICYSVAFWFALKASNAFLLSVGFSGLFFVRILDSSFLSAANFSRSFLAFLSSLFFFFFSFSSWILFYSSFLTASFD